MIRLERSPDGRLRLIGALKAGADSPLSRMLGGGEETLDLSEVVEADAAAVRLLARMPPDRFSLADCPKWLALWIEQERRSLTGHREVHDDRERG